MPYLKEITDADIGGIVDFKWPYKIRRATRGILIRDNGKVALIHAAEFWYYKIPGGGIDKWETVEEALVREVREEAWCTDIEIIWNLWIVLSYKKELKRLQIDHCFIMKTHQIKFIPEFTKKEKRNGFSLDWEFPKEALALMKQGRTDDYNEKFKLLRDLYLMEKYISTL